MRDSDRETTLPSVAELHPGESSPGGIAVTIVFHPQLQRIGERGVIAPCRDDDVAVIGRAGPLFGRRCGGSGESGEPLADRHVSRRALVVQLQGDLFNLKRRVP